jgi:putative phosphoesterase
MIAILSDIHGNFIALQEVLNAIDRLGVKQIYCLGDTVGYYSQVNECCDELRRRSISSVMGNHDFYMATGTDCSRSQSVRDCMAYQRKVITLQNLEWVRSLPQEMEAEDIRFVHGGWQDPIDEYLSPSEEYFARLEGDCFMSGHTHIPIVAHYASKTYCNPGSVGQPRDNDPRASFALFDGKDFSIQRVSYDVEAVGRLMEDAGFGEYYYARLRTGKRNF